MNKEILHLEALYLKIKFNNKFGKGGNIKKIPFVP
jgi:hypothetical protein